MLNFILLLLIICIAVFFLNTYSRLSRIESDMKSLLEKVELYLIKNYGDGDE